MKCLWTVVIFLSLYLWDGWEKWFQAGESHLNDNCNDNKINCVKNYVCVNVLCFKSDDIDG